MVFGGLMTRGLSAQSSSSSAMAWAGAMRPKNTAPHKTIYNRFIRWSRLGVFNRIFAALSARSGKPDRLIIDTTHLKAHRTAACSKGDVPRRVGRTNGDLNSKLHAVCDTGGHPQVMLPSKDQMSDYKGLCPDARCIAASQGNTGRQRL